jgi:PST family polysaccharide transporter
MFLRVKSIIKHKDYIKLVENFLSLSVLNIVNYLFPIILIPYLTRTLGVEKYGIYAFGLAIINYFSLLVNYGFDFSATKQVAIIRDNKARLNRLFSSVLTVRLFLVLIALVLLTLATIIVPKLYTERVLLFSGVGIFIGIALIPIWLFQGLENMKVVAMVNFCTRLFSTVLIFLFVKEQMDYKLTLLFQSCGYLVGGILSVLLSVKMFKIRFVLPNITELMLQFKEGWHIFLSTIGMNFYRETNTIILGFVTNYTVVGYYAAAEKIIKVVQSFTSPIVNTLYPYFGRRLNVGENTSKNFQRFKKLGIYYSFLLIFIAISVALFSPWIIRNYLGILYVSSITNIQIMSLVLVFGSLNYYYGIIGLVNIGKEVLFARAVWISGILSTILCYILSKTLDDKGAAISMVSAEILLFVQIIIYLNGTDSNAKYSTAKIISEPII